MWIGVQGRLSRAATIWPEDSDESWGGHIRHRHGLDRRGIGPAATAGISVATEVRVADLLARMTSRALLPGDDQA